MREAIGAVNTEYLPNLNDSNRCIAACAEPDGALLCGRRQAPSSMLGLPFLRAVRHANGIGYAYERGICVESNSDDVSG